MYKEKKNIEKVSWSIRRFFLIKIFCKNNFSTYDKTVYFLRCPQPRTTGEMDERLQIANYLCVEDFETLHIPQYNLVELYGHIFVSTNIMSSVQCPIYYVF